MAPRAVGRLPERARLMITVILLAAEALGCWASALELVRIVLLPKPGGGLRPIGLFPTSIRIWVRARALIARAWAVAHDIPTVFGEAGKGAQRTLHIVVSPRAGQSKCNLCQPCFMDCQRWELRLQRWIVYGCVSLAVT